MRPPSFAGPLTVLLLAPYTAHATNWVGSDYAGADLVTADGDTMTGVFTNVGDFVVPAGARVTLLPGLVLEVHAATIDVDGTLDGTGAGSPGAPGIPSNPGAGLNGLPGTGPGLGQGGLPGPCVHGGGGGGAAYGGNGGRGSYYFTPTALGGTSYGDDTDETDRPLGSGGGGAGTGCAAGTGARGGHGGGSIFLDAVTITVDGSVLANGGGGANDTTTWGGGGGGGSGGTIVLQAGDVLGIGTVAARGGRGGDTTLGVGGLCGGGGGGGGGRIKVLNATLGSLVFDVAAGAKGADQSVNYGTPGENGQAGTVTFQPITTDVDGDGVDIPADNCPTIANPGQEDDDGDNVGDVCDPCPDASDPLDSDGDGVCDGDDACPGFDDFEDTDGDAWPDGCDVCPDVSDPGQLDSDGDFTGNACDICPLPSDPSDSDGDGVCDGVDTCPAFDDSIDRDEDGIANACDLCPTDVDPDQLDADGDGAGDACDVCPTLADPTDSDEDTVCDNADACPGGDDREDEDADGQPDACDPCPVDPADDQDGDGICDGVDLCPTAPDWEADTDGDGWVDEGCDNCPDVWQPSQRDYDGDGFGDLCDCGIGRADIHPGADEVCNDEDDDCDGDYDENPIDGPTYWQDADGDGFGDPDSPWTACDGGEGLVDNSDDCDDFHSEARPGGTEICDGLDNECDGTVDNGLSCPTDDTTADEGGCGCDTGSGPGGVLWLAPIVLLTSRRRRR